MDPGTSGQSGRRPRSSEGMSSCAMKPPWRDDTARKGIPRATAISSDSTPINHYTTTPYAISVPEPCIFETLAAIKVGTFRLLQRGHYCPTGAKKEPPGPAGPGGSHSPSGAIQRPDSGSGLPPEVHEFLQHFVTGRDNTRIRLKSPLRHDHVCKLLSQIDVRHLQ
jgi:hypothetical protein